MTPLQILTIATRMKQVAQIKAGNAEQLGRQMTEFAQLLIDLAANATREAEGKVVMMFTAEDIEILERFAAEGPYLGLEGEEMRARITDAKEHLAK